MSPLVLYLKGLIIKKIKVEAQIKYISHRNAVKYNTEWL